MRRSVIGYVGLGSLVVGALACNDFDTKRSPPPRGTVGEEVFGVLCDRIGAQSLREDMTGASFRDVCHKKGDGSYADQVDESKLPSVTAEGREAKPVRVASTVSGARVAVYVVQCIFGVGLVLMPIVLSRGVLRTLDPTEVDVQLAHGESPGPTAARPVVSPTPAAAATPPSVPPAFCATCGAQLSKGAAFCGGCGARTRR